MIQHYFQDTTAPMPTPELSPWDMAGLVGARVIVEVCPARTSLTNRTLVAGIVEAIVREEGPVGGIPETTILLRGGARASFKPYHVVTVTRLADPA